MAADLNVKVDVSDALAALKALEDADVKQRVAEKVADEVALPRLMQYPPASGRRMNFKSAKQRAFVIAAIRSGAIQVPYSRTGNLGSSYQKQPNADGISLVSNAPYAAYVRGPGQAEYFKGVWPTHEEIAQQSEADAALAATAALVEIIGDAGP